MKDNITIYMKLEGVEEVKNTIKELNDELLKAKTHYFSEKELHCMAYMIQGSIGGHRCNCGVCKYAPEEIASCEVDLQVRKKLMYMTGVYLGVARKRTPKMPNTLAEELVHRLKDQHHGCW